MVDPARPRYRTPAARLLAPIAFFTAATVLILIVHNSLEARPAEAPPPPPAAVADDTEGNEAEAEGPARQEDEARPQRRFHRVQEGDTLEGIAARYDTTVEDLLELNPDIDPLALSPGQRIRIR